MKGRRQHLIPVTLLVLAVMAASVSWSAPHAVSVSGYVLDSACAFVKNLKQPVSSQCAVACAKAGSPLVILADDGQLWWPISDAVPAHGQNARLLPFAGKHVTVTGAAYEKGGSKALVIETIQLAPK